jgi:hypothetical protein
MIKSIVDYDVGAKIAIEHFPRAIQRRFCDDLGIRVEQVASAALPFETSAQPRAQHRFV